MENQEEEVKQLADYELIELQELISAAHRSYRTEEDTNKKKLKKKHLLTIVRHYNTRVGFKAYKETL